MKSNLLSLAFIIIFCAGIFADTSSTYYDASAQASAKYLEFGDSAAAAGMGEAYTGVVTDAPAIFLNPAGLANMQVENKDWSVFCDQNMWFQNIMTSSIAVAKNINKTGVFGLGVMYYNSGTEARQALIPTGIQYRHPSFRAHFRLMR